MKKDFGYRTIQCSGRGSYVTSLPKEWVKMVGLKKGSQISISLNNNLSLLLTPKSVIENKISREESKPEFRIDLRENDDISTLNRIIKALYVVSADIIHFRSKSGAFTQQQKNAIKDLVRNELLGSEIISEGDNDLTIQTFVSHSDFSIEKAIRRMMSLTLMLNKNAILLLKKLDDDRIKILEDTFTSVKRLELYSIRQLKFGIKHGMLEEMGFSTPKEFLGYRVVISQITSIAENSMNVANKIVDLYNFNRQDKILKYSLDNTLLLNLREINSLTETLLRKSISMLFEKDFWAADKFFSEIPDFAILDTKIFSLLHNRKMDLSNLILVGLIIECLRYTIEASRNIAEVTLNRTVEKIFATEST